MNALTEELKPIFNDAGDAAATTERLTKVGKPARDAQVLASAMVEIHSHASIVGVARYVMWPDRAGAADVAIEVADDLQRNGIGLMLAEALIRRAEENRINVLTATTLWENHAARALARHVGFRARASAGSEIELELQLSDHAEHDTT